MTKVFSLLAIAAIAAVGAAGCGSGEQNDYVDQVNALQQELVAQVTAEVSGAAPSNANEAARVAEELGQIFTDGADDFAAVEPPEEVADLHAQLVEQIDAIGDQISDAADAFTSDNAQQAAQAATQLQTAVGSAQTDLNSLIDQINDEFGN